MFIHYIADNKITEQFLCSEELVVQTSGQDIFPTVTECLQDVGLTWKLCVGICTDVTPSVVWTVKGFVALVKNENPGLITAHCFLHCEAVVAKTLGPELKSVFYCKVKTINFIKSRPIVKNISLQCEEIGCAHTELLLHTEFMWLSRGRVLSKLHQLKEEMFTIFTLDEKTEFLLTTC